ncbi:FAD-dependent oxidoreductase [Leifsonia sp. LS-T14]|uniref:FAD-dependent oxidoreductase n=1 Tax=unclassified Leifsonia TaxID=2663824 RepID=UPI0035A73F47
MTPDSRAANPDLDAAVIGAGFYGLRIALHLRETMGLRRIRVFEREPEVMERASYANQARVHNGYHYPRSILTAYRSRINFPRFVDEYRPAIVDGFEHIYAVGRLHSKVTAHQFELFCTRIGAVWGTAPKAAAALFDQGRIERAFVVREPAFDSRVLRGLLLDRIQRAGGIEIATSDGVDSLARGARGDVVVHAASGEYRAGQVFSAVYSRLNELHRASGLPTVALQHEVSELALVDVPEELRSIGITVMDGPFFSLMPFPSRGLHTLSHVRFTPRYRWREGSGGGETPIAERALEVARGQSGFAAMRADASRYVPALRAARHVDSLREVKTVLTRSELDDSRPILHRRNYGMPNYTCILGGKLDNIYDSLDEIGTAAHAA